MKDEPTRSVIDEPSKLNEARFSRKETPLATILIADDEPSIRSFIGRVVEMMGHQSVQAATGKEALELYGRTPVDLSFVDINMPEMDGIHFLEYVKKQDPKAVVIVMTGFPSAETIVETIEDDGYTYISKPIQIDRLKDLVNRGLEFRKQKLNGHR
jgi:two-component system, NtrC family, response regulator PilR